MLYGPPELRNLLLSVCLMVVWTIDTYSPYSIWRFDVDVPGGRVYKESSFTEPGRTVYLNKSLLLALVLPALELR